MALMVKSWRKAPSPAAARRPLLQGRGDDAAPQRFCVTSPLGERSDCASNPGEGAFAVFGADTAPGSVRCP
jgi:hypothetical protein